MLLLLGKKRDYFNNSLKEQLKLKGMYGKSWINHKDKATEFNPARSYLHFLNNYLEQTTPTKKTDKKEKLLQRRVLTKDKTAMHQKKIHHQKEQTKETKERTGRVVEKIEQGVNTKSRSQHQSPQQVKGGKEMQMKSFVMKIPQIKSLSLKRNFQENKQMSSIWAKRLSKREKMWNRINKGTKKKPTNNKIKKSASKNPRKNLTQVLMNFPNPYKKSPKKKKRNFQKRKLLYNNTYPQVLCKHVFPKFQIPLSATGTGYPNNTFMVKTKRETPSIRWSDRNTSEVSFQEVENKQWMSYTNRKPYVSMKQEYEFDRYIRQQLKRRQEISKNDVIKSRRKILPNISLSLRNFFDVSDKHSSIIPKYQRRKSLDADFRFV